MEFYRHMGLQIAQCFWYLTNSDLFWSKVVSFVDNLFGHIASSGFSQQSVKLVWEREGGDGASELVGCSPCGASSVPSSWHHSINRIAPWTNWACLSLLPVSGTKLVIFSLNRKLRSRKCCQYTRENRWSLQALSRLKVRHLSLLVGPTPIKQLLEDTYFSKVLKNTVAQVLWVLL